ncbi:MAG: phosphate propanoyltransferase [bacterium]
MVDLKGLVEEIVRKIERSQKPVVCNVSSRHVHVTEDVFRGLFGSSYPLRKLRDLRQPGEYASKETVEVSGPKGVLKKVRILGPLRKYTQVEVSRTDCYALGISAPVRESGNIKGSAPVKLAGPQGEVDLQEGCIVARRHIHMTPSDADAFNLTDGQQGRIQFSGGRSGILNDVLIRVAPNYILECHIDTDEANAFDFKSGGYIYIV